MSSNIEVREIRVSLIWVAEHLDGIPKATAHVDPVALSREDSYSEAFARARAARPPVEWAVPWYHPRGDNFWNYYLERKDLNFISAAYAMNRLVPLRLLSGVGAVTAEEQGGLNARLTLFVFPFAVGAEFTLRVHTREPWTFGKAADHLQELRHKARFVRSEEGTAAVPQRLDALGEQAVERARAALFRQEAPALAPLSPFSVVTIMQVGDGATEAVVDGDDMHRVLQGLSRWSPTWRADSLVALASSQSLPRKTTPPAHVVLRAPRGRVVWFPLYAAPDGESSKLGCYHRNLVAAALQTEAQTALLHWLDSRLDGWGDLPGVVQTWARRAAGSLQRLYVAKDTYRSGSCRAHLDDSDSLPALVRLRARLGMSPE